MADNNIDVPVLVCKLLAYSTCTTGNILEGGFMTGWRDATADQLACGVIAMEPGVAGSYFTAMIMGTAYMKIADSIKCGRPVEWSAALTVDTITDSASKTIGMALDGAAAAVTTATSRIFFNGRGTRVTAW